MLISTPMDLKQPRQMSFGTETHHFQPFPNSDHDPLSLLYVVLELWNLFQSIARTQFSRKVYHNDRVISNRFRDIAVLNLTPDSREARAPSPSGITKQNQNYIYECPSGTSFAFVYSRRWVKSSSYVTALKLRSSITWDRNVVQTRSQRQNSTKSTRESFGNVRFIVRQEINFAKVKSRHFRRAKCLDSIALDILNVRRDSHRSVKDFAISLGVEVLYADHWAYSDRARADCWRALCKKISRKGFAFFSCYVSWLVILLFSALYCGKHWIGTKFIRHFLTVNRIFRT